MLPSAAELVARFLRTNGYSETLESFIKEASLPSDAGASTDGVTIEQVLQEKRTFDLSLSFEKLGLEQENSWKTPDPRTPLTVTTLPTSSNILSVHFVSLALDESTDDSKPYIAVTTADRRLSLIDAGSPDFSLSKSFAEFQDSPLLDIAVLKHRYILTASMSGRLTLFDVSMDRVIDQRKDHNKYVVKLTTWSEGESTIIASAGWDSRIFLYRIGPINETVPRLGEPLAEIVLPSIPECISFVPALDTSLPILLLTRRDSSHLYYYSVPDSTSNAAVSLLGKQNLAPHSAAWVAFTPTDVRLCPTDPTLAAVATSNTPHMKLIIVRLLVPPISRVRDIHTPASNSDPSLVPELVLDSSRSHTQASLARAELATQDKEEAAITLSCTTMAPQTAYSTPKLSWRPDGTGVYVNSDDGLIRGFETTTGKLAATLSAHQVETKVRCLTTFSLKEMFLDHAAKNPTREFLVSGGFDQRLIVWRTN